MAEPTSTGAGPGDGVAPAASAASAADVDAQRYPTRHGAGRVLIAVYAVFALSATARALFQLTAQYERAPLAYWLSALSGVVYLLATCGLVGASAAWRRVALAAVSVEALGVVAVGTWSVLDPGAFADASVWSDFGAGYGYVPVVLPLLGLAWLARTRGGRAAGGRRRAGG